MFSSRYKLRCAAAVAAALAAPLATLASSHREAPAITATPEDDGTDFYMFMSYEPGRDGYVTLLADYYPFQEPFGGPNYYALDDAARYYIRLDTDGDGIDDLTFVFQVGNKIPNNGRGAQLPVGGSKVSVPLKNVGPVSAGNTAALNYNETYDLLIRRGNTTATQGITNAADGTSTFVKPYDYVGTKTFGSDAGYAAYANQYIYNINIPGCDHPGRVFVGQRREPFQVNLGKIFDLVNLVPVEANAVPNLPGIAQSKSNNVLANKNITTFALEVYSGCLKGSGNGTIGGWTTVSVPQARVLAATANATQPMVQVGALTQVSRLGMPLVNEVVIGLPDKDGFNRSAPKDDARYLTYVTNPSLPAILDTLFRDPVNKAIGQSLPSIAPANFPRQDLVTAYLTGFKGVNQLATVTPSEMTRLNMTLPVTPAAQQSSMGVLAGDLAGFPNGRRPGDDVVDISLRVAMGALCYPLTIGGKSTDLGLCKPTDAPVGNVPFTDGAPSSAADYDTTFPYIKAPLAGSSDIQ